MYAMNELSKVLQVMPNVKEDILGEGKVGMENSDYSL